MADQTSGIEVMRRRMERASRQAPPPRRAREAGQDPSPGAVGEGVAPPPPEPSVSEAPGPAPAARATSTTPSPRRRARPDPVRLAADLPPANLAIRVRRPLDERLAEVIHALRRDGVRTSKVEMIEMLLWELPEEDPQEMRERLRRFRDWAPRGAGAPLGDPESS